MSALNQRLISKDAALASLSSIQSGIDKSVTRSRNFADGGPVIGSPQNSSAIQINVNNTGTAQRVVSSSFERDNKGLILNILMEDADRNGPLFRRYKSAIGGAQ
jgi:hypothetical protein